MSLQERKKIAIVGSGISGLLCAYLLSRRYDVHLFEAADYLGGHTATKKVRVSGEDYDIDTGFIVFNDRTYPNFIKLLKNLDIAYQKTAMGFSVSDQESKFEYSGTSFNGLFAQRKNIFNGQHWKMLIDILRFNKQCIALHEGNKIPEGITLGEYLNQQGYSFYFQHYYILPMVSAIWSSGLATASAMPLVFFIRFFYNHGLLTVTDQPQWYTLVGGSKSYIPALIAPYQKSIRMGCSVKAIKRLNSGVTLYSDSGEQEFDELVLACHSDQALALLVDPTDAERKILSAIPYKENDVVLHTDVGLLPQAKQAWASWNYKLFNSSNTQSDAAALTYNMNILQNITAATTFCVSVNASPYIAAEKILGRYTYSHPVFTTESVAAQAKWSEISGVQHTHYSGAYWRNGFHEDGVFSAIRVAQALGIDYDIL